MTRENNHQPDGMPASPAGPRFSRRRLAIGTVGVAALLGPGAYLVTDRLVSEADHDTAQEVTVIAPMTPPSSAASGAAAGAANPGPSAARTTQAAGAPLSDETVREILRARKKMEKDGVEVKRPLKTDGAAQAASVEATTEGSLNSGGIVRMVTAKEDLTGQRELAWVSGGIKKYRGVPCSQTVRFSAGSEPEKKDNLLICWRTSETKSVISIVVDPEGKPSRAKAVGALEKEWRSMD